jgi:anhydro-N-acetylmuramic acid kinase
MVYRAIGLMSGSSLDGLDIVFASFEHQGGKWSYSILESACYIYEKEWLEKLTKATRLPALEYQLLHTEFGHYMGQRVNEFIEDRHLQFQVALIASHGHTTFHVPAKKMTAQLGDGAAIAAATHLPVVSDLRAMDIAFGGQGAPIVPIGEKLLMDEYRCFLNIGGIANISSNDKEYTGFDVCPANRVLNMLSSETGARYDNGGSIAATGQINNSLLEQLNQLDYYRQNAPKSLANEFGTNIVYPVIKNAGISIPDALRTYTEHIAIQIKNAAAGFHQSTGVSQILVTGGGAFNTFLIDRLKDQLKNLSIEVVVPDASLVSYKEALIMAFLGVLRWREQNTALASVTGASRASIGGALWMGQEA